LFSNAMRTAASGVSGSRNKASMSAATRCCCSSLRCHAGFSPMRRSICSDTASKPPSADSAAQPPRTASTSGNASQRATTWETRVMARS
jgi:hypothetical protein